MRFAVIADARAVRPVHDGAVGADDVDDAPVFYRALLHLVRFQALGVPRGDVALQLPRDGRAEPGRDARLRVLQEWEYRGRTLESVAYIS